jgi:hypothetical protein
MPGENKLNILIRVEPGSLGPDGLDHVEPFCDVAKRYYSRLYTELVDWDVLPRYDKTLPEMEFTINGRPLTSQQTEKMLQLVNKDEEQIEMEVMDHLAKLIDKYLGHKY